MSGIPDDPFVLAPSATAEIAARRTVELFGAVSELAWIPARRHRQGRPGAGRPAFLPQVAPRILAEETVWSNDRVALTPNRHPFGPRHALLWSRTPRREADATLLRAAFDWADRTGGAVLANSIGAAASIPWAHVHLVGEDNPFLPALARCQVADLPADLDTDEVGIQRAAAPVLLLAVTGPADARAHTVGDLLARRSAAAFNLADQHGTSWLMPRSAVETPAPDFPQAFGAAELWGRWCFDDDAAFGAASASSLERAFVRSGMTAV